MVIHVVRSNETVSSIARTYGVTARSIIENNDLSDPSRLAVGQTLVILFPEVVHVVAQGESLYSIAARYGVSVNQLLRNNPILNGLDLIIPGQTLVISYVRRPLGLFEVNGYAYPNIDHGVLRRTLPYLTYITLFTYGINNEGGLIPIDDDEVIAIARGYGVAPIMMIATLNEEGRFSNQLANMLLNDEGMQDRLIAEIIENMERKGYVALDVDFEYILPEDGPQYVKFIDKVTNSLNARGFTVIVALAPKTSADQPGLLYESHDYRALGAVANAVLIMTYEWGYTYGPPMAVAPYNKVREVVEYAVSEIEPNKIFMGMPNYGYDWTLPFVRGESRARSLSNVQAVELAVDTVSTIEFDPVAKAPFFYYTADNRAHVVWFEDANSVNNKLRLPEEFGLLGVSYWNIMRYFPQNWLVINSLYDIVRIEGIGPDITPPG